MKKPELPSETEEYYFIHVPIYERYKTVTVIDRCECCDHKIGSHEEKRGVHLIGWEVDKIKKDGWYHINRAMTKLGSINVIPPI